MLPRERTRFALYRLQQRLAITRREVMALWIVLAVLFGGVLIGEYRQRTLRFDPTLYAASDSLFEAAVQALAPDSGRTASAPAAGDTVGAIASVKQININIAPPAELERLPRIGPAMARRIVAYRERYGPFRRPEDLMRVRGIGPKTYERLAPLVVVE